MLCGSHLCFADMFGGGAQAQAGGVMSADPHDGRVLVKLHETAEFVACDPARLEVVAEISPGSVAVPPPAGAFTLGSLDWDEIERNSVGYGGAHPKTCGHGCVTSLT